MSRPKLLHAVRDQVEIHVATLDDLLPHEHLARDVWRFVEKLDLSGFYARIRSFEGEGGAPTFDPRVLLALWLYATAADGVGSARRLARLCEEHLAYRWIAGGLRVNYHTLADFRSDHAALLEKLLVSSVAALAMEGLIKIDGITVAHDGTRVRASAGRNKFHGRAKLESALAAARSHVDKVVAEAACSEGEETARTRQQAARERAARERMERLEAALDHIVEVEKAQRVRTDREPAPPRASTTDPDATMQRMANGGMDIAHNIQWTTEVTTRAIVSVTLARAGSDTGVLLPAMDNFQRHYGTRPANVLADQGYFKYDDIEQLERSNCRVSMPDKYPGAYKGGSQLRLGETIRAWRERMTTAGEKNKYRLRSSTVEWSNARVRSQGLQQLPVRGTTRVLAVALLHGVAHNMMRAIALLGKGLAPRVLVAETT